MTNQTLDNLINRNATQKRPMYDIEVHNFHCNLNSETNKNPKGLIRQFKKEMHEWILSHKQIVFSNLNKFEDRNICLGVTHQLDEVHMMNKQVVIFEGEYKYHQR